MNERELRVEIEKMLANLREQRAALEKRIQACEIFIETLKSDSPVKFLFRAKKGKSQDFQAVSQVKQKPSKAEHPMTKWSPRDRSQYREYFIRVVEALKKAGRPMTRRELMAAASLKEFQLSSVLYRTHAHEFVSEQATGDKRGKVWWLVDPAKTVDHELPLPTPVSTETSSPSASSSPPAKNVLSVNSSMASV